MRIPSDGAAEKNGNEKWKTKVYQSSSGGGNAFATPPDGKTKLQDEPWWDHIIQKGLISHFDSTSTDLPGKKSKIMFQEGSSIQDVDVIIFATGYLYNLPFLKIQDWPWREPSIRPLDKEILEVDVLGNEGSPQQMSEKESKKGRGTLGGIQGQGMRNIDELQLFLKKDRSFALLGLREWKG